METTLPFRRFPKYPHLLPGDVKLWELFLDANHPDILTVVYDVHLGPGTEIPTNLPDNIKRMATAITQYRVDVIVSTKTTIHPVEIKPQAGLTALGQALGYTYMYKLERSPDLPVQATVLTNFLKPGLATLYKSYGVEVWTVDSPLISVEPT